MEYRFRITNLGSTPADLTGAEIVGDAASRFELSGFDPVTLQRYQSMEFAVAFSASEVGSVWATLRVLGQAGDSLLTRSIEGRGKVAREFQLHQLNGEVWQNEEEISLGDVTVGARMGQTLGVLKEIPVPGAPGVGGSALFLARFEGRDAVECEAIFQPHPEEWMERWPNIARFNFTVRELILDFRFLAKLTGEKEAWLVIEEIGSLGNFATNRSLRLKVTANALVPWTPVFLTQPKSAFTVKEAMNGFRANGSVEFRATIWRQGGKKGWMDLSHSNLATLSSHTGWNKPGWGRYRIGLANYYGSTLSHEFWIGQISASEGGKSTRLPAGRTGKVVSKARAPALQFQWMREGVPLVEGEKHVGVNRRELSIKNVTEEDAGAYQCRLTMPAPDGPVSIDDREVWVTVYQRPEVKPFSLRPTQVFEAHVFEVEMKADNDWGHTFRIEGLPPGLRQNKRTGEVIGRIAPAAAPQAARDYVVTVWATNGAGTSEPFVTTWRVEPYSFSGFQGTYEGLLTMTNRLSGGKLRLMIDGKGGFSGRVWRPLYGAGRAVRGFLFAPGVAAHDSPAEGEPSWPAGMVAPGVAPIGVAFYDWDRWSGRIDWLVFSLGSNQLAGTIGTSGILVPEFYAIRRAAAPQGAAGLHHLQIGGAVWTPGGQSLAVPGGTGFARVWLGSNGVARWVSRLGDSTSASGSAGGGWLPETSQWVLPMRHEHRPTWSEAHGWTAWLGANSVSMAGEWQWKKRRGFSDDPPAWQRFYGNGIWVPQVPVQGSRFSIPQAGELAAGWPTEVPGAAAEIWGDSAGWTALAPEKMPVLLSPTGKVMAGVQAGDGEPWQRLVARYVPKTGLVSGQFVRPTEGDSMATSQVRFEGLWIPHLGRAVGVNWMSLPTHLVPSGSKFVPIAAGPLDFGPPLDGGNESGAEQ